MLEKESVDALFLCVPPFAHGDIEEKAAQKGIHLMVEKPLGLDVDTARYKLKVIQESGILCASGYCLRYLDTVKKSKRIFERQTNSDDSRTLYYFLCTTHGIGK